MQQQQQQQAGLMDPGALMMQGGNMGMDPNAMMMGQQMGQMGLGGRWFQDFDPTLLSFVQRDEKYI